MYPVVSERVAAGTCRSGARDKPCTLRNRAMSWIAPGGHRARAHFSSAASSFSKAEITCTKQMCMCCLSHSSRCLGNKSVISTHEVSAPEVETRCAEVREFRSKGLLCNDRYATNKEWAVRGCGGVCGRSQPCFPRFVAGACGRCVTVSTDCLRSETSGSVLYTQNVI